VAIKNKNMASINTSIQNKNLGGKDRYSNKSDMNITSESLVASKSNLGLMKKIKNSSKPDLNSVVPIDSKSEVDFKIDTHKVS
jgi:hypothetical protein